MPKSIADILDAIGNPPQDTPPSGAQLGITAQQVAAMLPPGTPLPPRIAPPSLAGYGRMAPRAVNPNVTASTDLGRTFSNIGTAIHNAPVPAVAGIGDYYGIGSEGSSNKGTSLEDLRLASQEPGLAGLLANLGGLTGAYGEIGPLGIKSALGGTRAVVNAAGRGAGAALEGAPQATGDFAGLMGQRVPQAVEAAARAKKVVPPDALNGVVPDLQRSLDQGIVTADAAKASQIEGGLNARIGGKGSLGVPGEGAGPASAQAVANQKLAQTAAEPHRIALGAPDAAARLKSLTDEQLLALREVAPKDPAVVAEVKSRGTALFASPLPTPKTYTNAAGGQIDFRNLTRAIQSAFGGTEGTAAGRLPPELAKYSGSGGVPGAAGRAVLVGDQTVIQALGPELSKSLAQGRIAQMAREAGVDENVIRKALGIGEPGPVVAPAPVDALPPDAPAATVLQTLTDPQVAALAEQATIPEVKAAAVAEQAARTPVTHPAALVDSMRAAGATDAEIAKFIGVKVSDLPPVGGPPKAPTAVTPGGLTPPVPPSTGAKTWDAFLSVWNLPKVLKASWDLSAPGRQGILTAAAHPSEFFGNFKPMVQAFGSEKFADAVDAEIRLGPKSTVVQDGLTKLGFVNPETGAAVRSPRLYVAAREGLTGREEAFMSKLAGKIPLIKNSERAYTTYLNKLRTDIYDNTLERWFENGKNPTQADIDGLADVINHFTGRGDIGAGVFGQEASKVLNGAFFSPRFTISRFQAAGDALGALKSRDSLAAKEAANMMVKSVAAGMTLLALAKLGGAGVEIDPRSANFGKIKVGDTTYDIWGGQQQIARYAAQFISGQTKVGSGKTAGTIQPANRLGTAGRFIQSKTSPSAGTVIGILGYAHQKADPSGTIGRDFVGNPYSATDLVNPTSRTNLITPLFGQDIADAVKDVVGHGGSVPGGVIKGAPSFFGIGVNTQQP